MNGSAPQIVNMHQNVLCTCKANAKANPVRFLSCLIILETWQFSPQEIIILTHICTSICVFVVPDFAARSLRSLVCTCDTCHNAMWQVG